MATTTKYYLDIDGLKQYDGLIKSHIQTEIGKETTRATGAEGTLTSLKTTAKGSLVGAVNEVFDKITDSSLSIKEIGTGLADDIAKAYEFYKGDATVASNKIGTINIPKDLFVESGEIVVLSTGQVSGKDAGTYIKLTLRNQASPLYINVKDLVEDFTVAQAAAQVQLAVSATRELSATIVDGGVTEGKIATGAVTEGKIGAGAVVNSKLAVDAVQTDNIKDGNVTTNKIHASAVTADKIADDAVTTTKILAKNVTTAKIADSAIGSEQLASGAVTNVKLASDAVESVNIKDGAVGTAKIADTAVTEAKLADNAVTAAKIKAGEISRDKINAAFEAEIADLEDTLADVKDTVDNTQSVPSTDISALFTATPPVSP